MTDREANELLKEAAVYADIRWISYKERLSEVSYRYLVSIKNDYERRHSKPALPSADVAPVVHAYWRDTGSGQECSACKEIQYGYDTGRHYCANCGAKMGSEDKE